MVNELDVFRLDKHVFDYSDNDRFVGYKSSPEDVTNYVNTLDKTLEGNSISDIYSYLRNRRTSVDAEKESYLNILSEDHDTKYYINQRVHESYLSRLVDEYAILDYMDNKMAYELFHKDLTDEYVGFGSPNNQYIAFGDQEAYLGIISYNEESMDVALEKFQEQNPNVEHFIPLVNEQFDYIKGLDYSEDNQQYEVILNGQAVQSLIKPKDKNLHPNRFELTQSDNPKDYGVYRVGEDYPEGVRIVESEGFTQKLTGKDSILEAEMNYMRMHDLQSYRMTAYKDLTTEITQETGRELYLDAIRPRKLSGRPSEADKQPIDGYSKDNGLEL